METKKFQVNFPFQVRQATNVAYAVAEEVGNGLRPELLSIAGATPTFRFQGGTVVGVNMVDLDTFTESWRTPHSQDWVVLSVEVRYYAHHTDSEKISEVWEAEKLSELKTRRPWYHPRVVDESTVTGTVGIFWNNGEGRGYCIADPERNQDGFYTLYERVEYARFVEGDLDRAWNEARQILQQLIDDCQR